VIVTAVERQQRRRRVNVFVDGRFALALGLDLAVEADLRPGRSINEDELAGLAQAEARRNARNAAQRLLTYRPRSERELRDRLARKGVAQAVIDETMQELIRQGYVNDEAYARYWRQTRDAFSPRSRRLLQSELRRKGVAAETAEEATAEVEDEDAAYRAASRRLRSLRGLDRQRFRERLGGFLTRRGFSYGVARRVIERCWEELSGEASPGSGMVVL